jgi:hypothetical protein
MNDESAGKMDTQLDQLKYLASIVETCEDAAGYLLKMLTFPQPSPTSVSASASADVCIKSKGNGVSTQMSDGAVTGTTTAAVLSAPPQAISAAGEDGPLTP